MRSAVGGVPMEKEGGKYPALACTDCVGEWAFTAGSLLDLDALLLRWLGLGQVDFEHTAVITGHYLISVRASRQHQRPVKPVIAPLREVKLLLFLFGLVLVLGTDGQQVTTE